MGSRTKVKAPSREEAAVSATPAKSTPAPKEIEVPKKKDNTGPKGNEGLWDVLTDQRASYALGIPWLTWNAVYIGLALFSAGSIVAFPVLYSVLLPPPSTGMTWWTNRRCRALCPWLAGSEHQ